MALERSFLVFWFGFKVMRLFKMDQTCVVFLMIWRYLLFRFRNFTILRVKKEKFLRIGVFGVKRFKLIHIHIGDFGILGLV